MKNSILFKFRAFFSKYMFLRLLYFFWSSVYPRNKIFCTGNTNLQDSYFWWDIFAFNYQNIYGYQTCHCRCWHIARSFHLKVYIKYQRGSLVRSRDKYNTYHHLLKSYKHQTRQVADLTLLAPVSQNGQTHSNNSSAVCDGLFECVWPLCGIGA